MAVISLPLTFNNSFWTQDYRTGLEVIFKKLEQARLFHARGRRVPDRRSSLARTGHR